MPNQDREPKRRRPRPRLGILYLLAAVVGASLLLQMWQTYQTVAPIPYSEFEKLLERRGAERAACDIDKGIRTGGAGLDHELDKIVLALINREFREMITPLRAHFIAEILDRLCRMFNEALGDS